MKMVIVMHSFSLAPSCLFICMLCFSCEHSSQFPIGRLVDGQGTQYDGSDVVKLASQHGNDFNNGAYQTPEHGNPSNNELYQAPEHGNPSDNELYLAPKHGNPSDDELYPAPVLGNPSDDDLYSEDEIYDDLSYDNQVNAGANGFPYYMAHEDTELADVTNATVAQQISILEEDGHIRSDTFSLFLMKKFRDIRHGHRTRDPLFWFLFIYFLLSLVLSTILSVLAIIKMWKHFCDNENIVHSDLILHKPSSQMHSRSSSHIQPKVSSHLQAKRSSQISAKVSNNGRREKQGAGNSGRRGSAALQAQRHRNSLKKTLSVNANNNDDLLLRRPLNCKACVHYYPTHGYNIGLNANSRNSLDHGPRSHTDGMT